MGVRKGSPTLIEIEYPGINNFDKQKLPTHKEIIGMAKRLNEKQTWENSIKEVSNKVWNHWIERQVYPISLVSVKKRVQKEVDTYKDLKKQSIGRSNTQSWKNKANIFIQNKNKLFDIFCEDTEVRKKQEEKFKIPMQLEDFHYLESMRTDRKGICESKTDKEWHIKEKKRQEKHEHYLHTQYNAKPTVEPLEHDDSSSNSDNTEEYLPEDEKNESSPKKRARDSNTTGRKKSIYKDVLENKDDELPYHLRHVRISEKIVRNEVRKVIFLYFFFCHSGYMNKCIDIRIIIFIMQFTLNNINNS